MSDNNTAIVAAPNEEVLLVKDGLGRVTQYGIAQVLANNNIVPEGLTHPEKDARAFMAFCTMYGANPFAKEAYIVPFNTKIKGPGGQERWETLGAPVLGLEYWHRMANESGRVEGIRKYFVDKDFNPVPKTAPLATPPAGKPGEIVGCVCEVHLTDRKFPVEAVVLLEEVDSGKGQLWRDGQKKHGLEVRCEYRAIKAAISPQVGLPQQSAAQAMAMESRVVKMEMVQEAAGLPAAGTPAPSEDPFSAEDFRAWYTSEGFTAEQAKVAREACQFGGYKVEDLTDRQRRMIQAHLTASRNIIDVEPEELDAEDVPAKDAPAPAATPAAADGPDVLTVDYDALDGEALLEAYIELAEQAGLNMNAAAARYAKATSREDALTDIERLKSTVRGKRGEAKKLLE